MRNVDRLALGSILAAVLVFFGGFMLATSDWGESPTTSNTSGRGVAVASVAVPVMFEENRGQSDSAALFVSRVGSDSVQFYPNEVLIAAPDELGAKALPSRIALADANAHPTVRGGELSKSYTNYYLGNDPDKWFTGVPHYDSVVYEQVYPGIDWVWYGNESRLEYDLRIAPDADPSLAKLRFDADDELRLDTNGDLVIAASGRETRYLRPVVYQESKGRRQPVAGEYVLLSENRVGFELGDYDSGRELVIDPVLSYSGYFGDSRVEETASVVVDASGSAYVVSKAGNSVVVFKVKPDGSGLDYALVLGGTSVDTTGCKGSAIAVDEAGNVYVAGATQSSNFPTTEGAFSRSLSGANDLFIARLDSSGSLSYSTYLGGTASDGDPCIALGPNNDVYVAAETRSTAFPTTEGAYARTLDKLVDLTVSRLRLNAQGTADLIYSTYIGGECTDADPSLVVDDAGMIYVVAQTGLPATFPTTPNAYDSTHNGEIDIVFFKINPAGQGSQDLVYSTYFGGSGIDERFGNGKGIAIDRAGNVYIAGDTDSENVPVPTTPGAFDRTFNDEWDFFIAKFGPTAQGGYDLVFSTLLGGSGIDNGSGIVVDDAGLIYFSASSDSEDVPFPTVNPFQANYGGGSFDTVFGVLSPDGSELLMSSYLGGSSFDRYPDLFVDSAGRLTIVGDTASTNFPTANAPTGPPFGSSYRGTSDVFVSRFEQLGLRMVTISNASAMGQRLAAETIASGFGTGLAGQTLVATALPLPTELGGTLVRVIDSSSNTHTAKLFFVSEFQINYLIPAGASLGLAQVEIVRNGPVVSRDGINITNVSPGIYTANGTGSGAPAANFLLVKADNSRISGVAFDASAPAGQRTAVPLDMGDEGDGLYLTFFSTGSRGASTISATVDGVAVPALGPFVLNEFEGLEQDNIGPLPRSLMGRGLVKVRFFFDGVPANEVEINLQ